MSLLTSVVGVSVRARVIMPIDVQGHIVLAHQVHDLQHVHAMQHTYRDEVEWVYMAWEATIVLSTVCMLKLHKLRHADVMKTSTVCMPAGLL